MQAGAGAHAVRWDQRIEGTPFASVLSSCETELRLAPAHAAAEPQATAATEVTIELRQEMRKGSARIGGSVPRAGSFLVRRAALATVEEALDGLERISG